MKSSNGPYSIELPPSELFNSGNFLDLFRLSFNQLNDLYRNETSPNSAANDYGAIWRHNPNIYVDIICALIGATLFTVLRTLLGEKALRFMVRNGLLDTKDRRRYSECLYGTTFYTISFLLASSIVSERQYLVHSENLWNGFTFSDSVPLTIWLLYMLELSHYLHSSYAVFFVNQWTYGDSIIIFIHHIFALLLLSISYLTKMHRIGVLVVYLFDICDIFLESIKCIIKLKLKSSKAKMVAESIKVLQFVALLYFWFRFRLYLYPIRVIYPSAICFSYNSIDQWFPLSFALFLLLWLIFFLNIYWGYLLVKILYNTLRDGSSEIEDIRDNDDMENKIMEKKKNNKKKSK
ncbi:Ceramide synthase 1, partial [Blomia tropicalis]